MHRPSTIYRNQHCIAINFKSHTYPSSTINTKASTKQICLLICSQIRYTLHFFFFCFKGILFYISYSLCQIVKLFLCMYIIKMHLWEHISLASLYQYVTVIYAAVLWCPFIWVYSFGVYRLTFLLVLTCSVCKFGRSAAAEWHFSSKVSSVDDLWIRQDVFYDTAGFHFCADDKNKNTNVMFTHFVLLREDGLGFSTDSGVIGNTNICTSVKFYCGS